MTTNPAEEYLQMLKSHGFQPFLAESPVYKYMSVETALKTLGNSTLRFSSPLYFNDPFEMLDDFFDFRMKNRFILDSFRQQFPRMPQKELKKIASKYTPEEYKKAFKQVLEKQRKNALIFCSSTKFNNPLMWSHYADKHHGVCLGLRFPAIGTIDVRGKASLKPISMHVKYVDKIEPSEYFNTQEPAKSLAIFKWLFTKSNIWEYESEVRTFISNLGDFTKTEHQGYCDVKIPTNWFCEFYFGIGVNQDTIRRFNSLVSQTGHSFDKIERMLINPSTYGLSTSSLKSHW